jgi:GNAT superfamily N-acetyltransferase
MKVKLKDKVFNYRFAKKEDINRCVYLDKQVCKNTNPNFHDGYTKAELLRGIESINRTIVVFYKNKLVAFSQVEFARDDRLNWIDEFNLSKKDFLKSGYFGGTLVASKYRGYGIQDFFIKKREDYIKKVGCKYSLVSVHPKNKFSLNNIVSYNYILVKKRKNIFGKIRLFYKKKI